jgi:hypothetical protein
MYWQQSQIELLRIGHWPLAIEHWQLLGRERALVADSLPTNCQSSIADCQFSGKLKLGPVEVIESKLAASIFEPRFSL